jgi:hypothetical protein
MNSEESIREIANRACRETLEARTAELAEVLSRRIDEAIAERIEQTVSGRVEETVSRRVEEAVAERVEATVSQRVEEVVSQRIEEALASLPAPTPEAEPLKDLRDGAAAIAGARTQGDALDTLLAASAAIAPRCGLLIVRGTQATGWSCQPGLSPAENFKRATLDCSRGVGAAVINSGVSAVAGAAEIDPIFIGRLGVESGETVLLLPVVLKERVAAMLVALGREDKDLPGLELLVQVANLTLDLQAYRKAPAAEVARPVARPAVTHPAPAPASPAALAPAVQAAPPVRPMTPMRPAPVAVEEVVIPPPTPALPPAPVIQPRPVTAVASPGPDETHQKAARFARLLVDEIKLYNQNKVAEGRTHADLYRRLREDIEKSRAAYEKRYGESVKEADYFTRELLRILADNNRELMGQDFPG